MSSIKIFSFIVALTVSLTCSVTMAKELPRAIGPFKIGMPIGEFEYIAGVKAGDCLSDCDEGMKYAEVPVNKIIKYKPSVQSLEVFTLYDKVSIITFVENSIIVDYINKYGRPNKIIKQQPGLNIYIWSNNITQLSVVFSIKNKQTKSITIKNLTQ